MTDPSRLFVRIRQAVSLSRHRPPVPTHASSGRAFAEPFERAVRAKLSAGEWAAFGDLLRRQDEALKAARAGRPDAAAREFYALRAEHAGRPASPLSAALADIFIGAAEAYLEYRRANHGEAERLIRHASALDQAVIDDHGLTLMSAHRLQLGHNLVRLHARRGLHHEAVALAAGFMAYLEWETDALPGGLASPRRQLDSVPECIPQHYFDRLCAEAAMLLAGRFDAEARTLFGLLAPHARRTGCATSGYGREAHAWLACRSLALDGDVHRFLDMSAEIIAAGRKSEPLFWFAAVMDVIGLCRTWGPEGAELAAWLVRQTHLMEGAPFPLKKLAEAESTPSD